jgi:hypothetical protein
MLSEPNAVALVLKGANKEMSRQICRITMQVSCLHCRCSRLD